MTEKKIFIEYETEKKALDGCVDYIVSIINSSSMKKDFTNKILSDYLVMYPVRLLNITSLSVKKGWMCMNINNSKYKIILASSIGKLDYTQNADSKYFGVEYISQDNTYNKINLKQFIDEYKLETSKLREYTDWEKENKLELFNRTYNIQENFEKNIDFFKRIDKDMYETNLNDIIDKYHFFEVKDLSTYKNCLYIMAIDEYKQYYIGKCVRNLKSRIRKHWNESLIPSRQIWRGGFDYSRLKIDNFKMFDTTRVFVCNDINKLIEENLIEAMDKSINITNTFDVMDYEKMSVLDKAERIVINNSLCMLCLSDRVSLLTDPYYDRIQSILGIEKQNIRIKDYIKYFKFYRRDGEKL